LSISFWLILFCFFGGGGAEGPAGLLSVLADLLLLPPPLLRWCFFSP
jgi:hypothetical protein